MRERDVENYLVREARKRGLLAEKFTSPGRRSVPDRIVTGPRQHVFFVELKAPGKVPTRAQERDHERRRAKGFRVYVADCKTDVDTILDRERP